VRGVVPEVPKLVVNRLDGLVKQGIE
jgi:hypothetical protein